MAVALDPDGRRSQVHLARARPRRAAELLERAVVAGADHRAEDGRVEAAAGHPPPVDGAGHELAGFGRDGHDRAGVAVELAHLTVGQEPAPLVLEVVDPAPGGVGQAARAAPGGPAHDDDMGGAAHGAEAELSCHG
jgi:hypothetical protein